MLLRKRVGRCVQRSLLKSLGRETARSLGLSLGLSLRAECSKVGLPCDGCWVLPSFNHGFLHRGVVQRVWLWREKEKKREVGVGLRGWVSARGVFELAVQREVNSVQQAVDVRSSSRSWRLERACTLPNRGHGCTLEQAETFTLLTRGPGIQVRASDASQRAAISADSNAEHASLQKVIEGERLVTEERGSLP
ncbi:hypothetical protein BCR35DRAFT_184157 [Leucosporidium creatinivorum]|uniref:Uncharacterized protein n=1 Tax=Leucosporidium creatinivorum TaxID=106004 RepID=A0A1Y2E2V6_9BASI|nr:hypothetical protein BCR35DRAFT_184157 [Leucosporidium creatinivorum]